MIVFDVVTSQDRLREFRVQGHAGFADTGSDIVCSAVSVLVYNTINSCEKFAGVFLDVVDSGEQIVCRVPGGKLSDGAKILLQSLVFGIEQLTEQYPEYVELKFHH
jgi:uncharacterized protein YsxB (DUF464 family)